MRACYDPNATRPGMFYCATRGARAALRDVAGVEDPDAELEAFNAGVAVFDLSVWRRRGLTATVERALRRHARGPPLWRLGSNPPLVLAARGSLFQPIDARWNCDGLGWKKLVDLDPACLRRAFVWHWSGGRKPWVRGGLYRRLWWAQLEDARCLAALPIGAAGPASVSSSVVGTPHANINNNRVVVAGRRRRRR
mmetsp:Transcript_21552/g.85703  ORF Transcript_21552/g.85703 Transcript_21552/m.85703 type:complete len:195 (+) Transcript_21552:683-1267(+)